MKSWVLILLVVGVVVTVLLLISRKPTTVPTISAPIGGTTSVSGAIAGAFTGLIGAGSTALGDWIVSKFPATNAPIQPPPVGTVPKLSQPSNTSNTVYTPQQSGQILEA